MAIVQLNNALREAVLAEKAEIQRILQSLRIGYRRFQNKIVTSQDVISDVDVIFAKSKIRVG